MGANFHIHQKIDNNVVNATQQLNLYTLETLGGLPLLRVYNTRWLHSFKPCEGTKLVMDKLACMEMTEGEEVELDESGGLC